MELVRQGRMMVSLILRVLALAAIAIAVFLAWMHPQTLDITNVGWVLRGRDWGPNATGLSAYLRSGSGPGAHNPLIMAPEGVSLLMTDSIPLLALLLKPFAPLLPTGIQMIGPWLLACLLLQVGFAWLLVRKFAPDFLAAWLGAALLTLLPALINRYGHPSLCAHWLILWALWIFIDKRRAASLGWWLAVIGAAGLVHNYLLLMVGAIWASAILRQLASGGRRGTVALHIGAVGLLVLGIAALHGVLGAHFVPTHTYGAFPMALDALVNPANPSYSALLPSSPDDQGRGFEGFQYLGAGLIALVLIALILAALAAARVTARQAQLQDRPYGLIWLLPAFAVLTLLAISNIVLLHGALLLRLPLPTPLSDALDIVRASGRLFWPVAYTMVFAALVVVYRLPPRWAGITLAAALALQIVDIAPMVAAIRNETAEAARPGTYRRTLDPRWDRLIARSSAVEIQPPEPFRDLQLLEEIGWRAMLACRPMRFAYISRLSTRTRQRLDTDRRTFLMGRIDASRLYILYPNEPAPPALADKVRMLDGIAIIPPSVAAPAPTLCGDRQLR